MTSLKYIYYGIVFLEKNNVPTQCGCRDII